MAGIGKLNLKVAVVDSDRYARNAINAYLAWDRRTTVILKTDSPAGFWAERESGRLREAPDVFILDANHQGGAARLADEIARLRGAFPHLMVICLAQFADLELLHAAAEDGAKAYWLKDDARLHIGWAVCAAFCLARGDFSVSCSAASAARKLSHYRLSAARELPGPRRDLGFTPRARQAAELYVIEGMPVRLVANEMGVGESTVRGYIRKTYSILEAYHDDDGDYPSYMSQQEIAFMRITALDLSAECLRFLRDYKPRPPLPHPTPGPSPTSQGGE